MQGEYRYFYKLSGRLKLKYGLNITVQSGYSKDDLYLREYSYGSAATLKSKVAVSKTVANRDSFFKGNLNYVGDDTNESPLGEYYSARGTYIKHIEQNFLPGNLALGLDVNSSYNVIEKDQLSRPPSSLQLGMNYSDKKYLGPFVLSNKSFIKFNSFINSEDSETFKEEFTSLYGVSSELLFPIFKKQINSSHFIYPKIMVAFNQQDGRVSGNSFRSQEELSFGNLYAGKKYSNLSESEIGISLSMGVGYQTNWGNNDSFELSIGGLRLGETTYQPVDSNGLHQDQYNYLGSFKYKNKAGYSLYGEGLLTGVVIFYVGL